MQRRPEPLADPLYKSFSQTPWTAVLAAAREAMPGFRDGWERLARAYWYPLYAFIRRRNYSPEAASDLTQAFFAHLIRTEALDGLVEGHGRFRCFLLICLNNFLRQHHRHDTARMRRPPAGWLSLDQALAEQRYGLEPLDGATPERLYEQRWARAVLDQALVRVTNHYAAEDKRRLFEALVAHLARDPAAVPHAALAAELGLTEAAVRNEMYRLRQRFRVAFRAEVAATVPESEVDSEMRHLLRVLCG